MSGRHDIQRGRQCSRRRQECGSGCEGRWSQECGRVAEVGIEDVVHDEDGHFEQHGAAVVAFLGTINGVSKCDMQWR